MDRKKLLEKIMKCLALGKSSEEHEAAAALRQAQKLMERHGVTERELGAVGYVGEKVDISVQRGKKGKIPVTVAAVVNVISHAFGVEPVYSGDIRETDMSWNVTYFGPEHRVMLAVYAHTVVTRAIERGWKQFLFRNPLYKGRPGARSGFYLGWMRSVKAKIEEFAMTPEEAAGTDLVMREKYGKGLVKSDVSRQKLYNKAVSDGEQDGSAFNLHRPMGMERKLLE